MFVKLYSGGFLGLETYPVEVQVDISGGLPFFNIVGLADTAVKEAKERVRSAIKNGGFNFPSKRITVNLSPSDRRKSGSLYDLPIALGILAASGQVDILIFKDTVILGELALSGEIKPVRGILTIVLGLRKLGFKKFFIPAENLGELELIRDVEIYTAPDLRSAAVGDVEKVDFSKLKKRSRPSGGIKLDFSEVKGQKQAKRVLEIAVAGFHHAAMVGTPGSGKSMLAKRVPTIMPPMEEWEVLEVSQIYSVAGLLTDGLITERPFRSPHYTASETAIIGGGNNPSPGEISLAHRGVLFMDELPEFNRKVLEVLRQPLEDGKVLISRANYKVEFPSKFLWITALNPCPCGNYKHPFKECVCKPHQIKRYLKKISSPLWDRIDLKVWVNPVEERELLNRKSGESSAEIKERVLRAVEIQKGRNPDGKFNGELTNGEVEALAELEPKAKTLLVKAMEKLHLSARSYYKLLKVCLTIADLEGEEVIKVRHLSEALNYVREPLEF